MQSEVESLRQQLTTARNEISKLSPLSFRKMYPLKNDFNKNRNAYGFNRQNINNLKHVQRKDVETITKALSDFRCEGCAKKEEADKEQNEHKNGEENPQLSNANDTSNYMQPIGIISTSFPEKRAVPRQASVGGCLRGMVRLNSRVFTNPEHALEGLEEYSHMWLIYHFDRIDSHPKAKVAPPRLDGERVGVFSTRSPHRPCPIGLSLVEIDKIDGATITFFGTDMIDGTPLLDIKPYIPYYDSPFSGGSSRLLVDTASNSDFYGSRQEPDGEESNFSLLGAVGNNASANNHSFAVNQTPSQGSVKVPNWVVASHRLQVLFNQHAEQQLQELHVNKQCIVEILEQDPRSVYLRTRYFSQIFTFQLSEVTVTCKFDDKASTVTVVQIRRNENVQDDDSSIAEK